MKSFSCGDVVPGCVTRFEARDEAAILMQVADHACRDHGLMTFPDSLVEQVRARIQEVPAA